MLYPVGPVAGPIPRRTWKCALPDRGYIRFYRSVFEHPAFREEPFTEREAWTWLCANAAWKPRRQRMGEHIVDLARGELVGAVRFLAEKWGWSRGKVERFVIRLKNETMIETRTETGITIISVCNYDIYQGGDDDTETAVGRDPGQARDAAETEPRHGRDNRKELNTFKKGKEGEEPRGGLFGEETAVAVSAAPDFQSMFLAWYGIYPKKVDRADAEKALVRDLKKVKPDQVEDRFQQIMAGTRAYAAELEMNRTDRKYIKAPAVFINKGSWQNEVSTSPPRSATSNRVDSAIDGMFSDLTPGDYDGRSH